jgi:hypothetical protein
MNLTGLPWSFHPVARYKSSSFSEAANLDKYAERSFPIRLSLKFRCLVPTLVLSAGFAACLAQEEASQEGAVRLDKVIVGGPKDFIEVRHLVLEGTNEEIGKALAAIGKERYNVRPVPSDDPLRSRVQRRYIEKNYPILAERMRGVAAAYGKRFDDDAFDFNGLWYLTGFSAGCSVVHYPPSVMVDGKGVVSRNYEFPTGTILGMNPKPGQLGVNARPYVIEIHPTRGYPSLAICAFDLLSGVLDGINSEGLTVTVLGDEEQAEKSGIDRPDQHCVGLAELQSLRLLLDTCANVEEAKEALLMTKQYYQMQPVHYLIADRHGKAFVWEYAHGRNQEFIIENIGKPLLATNFSLNRHLDGKKPPTVQLAKEVCSRYCQLSERVAAEKGKLTLDFIKEIHKSVDATRPATKEAAPNRTLWHALYFPELRKVDVSFYLRDEPDPSEAGKSRIVRSDYLEFVLKNRNGQ